MKYVSRKVGCLPHLGANVQPMLIAWKKFVDVFKKDKDDDDLIQGFELRYSKDLRLWILVGSSRWLEMMSEDFSEGART